ncbi:M23 family metallopeptidase [Nocardia rhamnosiphila]|uniref:M23 family metallopeptidase n=1 Tax=Nocardia rhamnosiphila TaxID=426716 RepID=A0ABV2WX82_9NOCA|nr:M23 family metallopeptidase [Nocardia rhamnosiphila]
MAGVILAVAALLSSGSAAAAPEAGFDWPLHPRPVVGRPFDPPDQDWLPGHRGVDLVGAPGQAVYAAGPGVVVFAGKVAGKPVVAILHGGGLRTTYEPVEAEIPVGRRVTRGTRIGALGTGHAGCPAPACLHWGLRRESTTHASREYLDPLGLLRRTPIRLKPVERGTPTDDG